MIYDILYPYQQEACVAIVGRRKKAIFDDPGLGKTLTVLGAIEQAGLFEPGSKTLVLATRTGAALTWLPHADKFAPDDVLVIDAVRGSLPARRAKVHAALQTDAPVLVIANHDFIAVKPTDHTWKDNAIWQVEWDAIVVDESQRVLPTKAQHDAAQTQFWRGLGRLQSHPMTLRVPMSGTPDRGKLENRYGTWAFMLPEVYNYVGGITYDQWLSDTFRLRYKERFVRVRGRSVLVQQAIVESIRNPQKWHEIDDLLTIRRTKSEVAPQLPSKRYVDIALPFSLAQERAYDKFIEEFQRNGDDGTKQAADTFSIRATQFATVEHKISPKPGGGTIGEPIVGAKSPKLEWLIEWLEERGYDDGTNAGKVVITSQFASLLGWLYQSLSQVLHPARIETLTGKMTTNQRLLAQQRFQNGDADIMLLSMTLGDSIDLDAADDMIFLDRVYDPARVTQAEDRVHRVSRMHHVVIWRLITTGSIDEVIDTVNEKRYNTIGTTMDGRRGVDYARQVLARLAA